MSDLLRITGMVSGFDTDDLVKKLISVEQIKVDRVKQRRDYLVWQKDAYREIINKVREFKDEYFNYLKPATNFRMSTIFSNYTVSYNNQTTSDYINITATKDSAFLSKSITDIQMAKTATLSGTSLSKPIISSDVSGFDISTANENTRFTVTFNGVSKEITLDDISDATSDVTDLVDQIQTKLNTAFGVGNITVGNSGNQITFATDTSNKLVFDYAYNNGNEELFGTDLSSGLTLTNQNNKFKLTMTDNTTELSTTKTITLNTGNDLTLDQIINDMQTQIDSASGFGDGTPDSSKIRVLNINNRIVLKSVASAGTATGTLASGVINDSTVIESGVNDTLNVTINGEEKVLTLNAGTYSKTELLSQIQSKLNSSFGSNKAIVSLDDSDQLRFEEVDSNSSLATTGEEDGGLAAIGLVGADVNRSNKVDLNTNLSEVLKTFNTELVPNDTLGEDPEDIYDIEFSINGVSFGFDSTVTTLNEIITEVNNSQANVMMRYDEVSDSIVVESKDTGAVAGVQIADVAGEGNLMAVLGLDGQSANGTDAVITFDGGTADEMQLIRSTNSFTFDGVTFEIKQDFSGPTPIELSSNVDSTEMIDMIKGFVAKYNEMIGFINKEITEERARDYQPLTDAQKKEMSESEIEIWEEKAKAGILRSDRALGNMVMEMREALIDKVEGVGLSLWEIGITTTSNYSEGGKLVIDEAKLADALENKGEYITQLFTKTSDNYEEKGLSQRLYDIIQKNIATSRDANGYKGVLLEKAGIEGDASDIKNLLTNQINDYNDRIDDLKYKLTKKENDYYLLFSRMEKALYQMSSQSSYLTSLLGSGGTQ